MIDLPVVALLVPAFIVFACLCCWWPCAISEFHSTVDSSVDCDQFVQCVSFTCFCCALVPVIGLCSAMFAVVGNAGLFDSLAEHSCP